MLGKIAESFDLTAAERKDYKKEVGPRLKAMAYHVVQGDSKGRAWAKELPWNKGSTESAIPKAAPKGKPKPKPAKKSEAAVPFRTRTTKNSQKKSA